MTPEYAAGKLACAILAWRGTFASSVLLRSACVTLAHLEHRYRSPPAGVAHRVLVSEIGGWVEDLVGERVDYDPDGRMVRLPGK